MVAGEFGQCKHEKRCTTHNPFTCRATPTTFGEWAEEIGERLVLIGDWLVLIGERLVLIGDWLVLIGVRLVSTLAIIQQKCEKVNFLSWLLKNLEAL
jgi:hypothetical protein